MSFVKYFNLARSGQQRLNGLLYISKPFQIQQQSMSALEDKPVEASIRKKLTEQLNPLHLQIVNESYMHNVPRGSESHFKVMVVSDSFENQPLIKRHRLVNSILEHELASSLQALSIVAKTPKQWETADKRLEPSPKCQGGFGR